MTLALNAHYTSDISPINDTYGCLVWEASEMLNDIIICYNSLFLNLFVLPVATSREVLSVQMHMSRKMPALRTVKLETHTPLLREVSASIY